MSECYLGEIRNFGYARAPEGWQPCQGQLLTITANQALYSLLGTKYGGDGKTTFALPDLRGRIGVNINPASPDYQLGKAGGAENVTLTQGQMPTHNHAFQGRAEAGTSAAVAGNIVSSAAGSPAPPLYAPPSATPIPLNPGSVTVTGGGLPHPNIQPFLVTNYCIAVVGLYPPHP